jgi:hypothetical protein
VAQAFADAGSFPAQPSTIGLNPRFERQFTSKWGDQPAALAKPTAVSERSWMESRASGNSMQVSTSPTPPGVPNLGEMAPRVHRGGCRSDRAGIGRARSSARAAYRNRRLVAFR